MQTENQKDRVKYLKSLSNAKGAALRCVSAARIKLAMDMKTGNRAATAEELAEISLLDKAAVEADAAWMAA
jgi:hypothetical protein